MKCITPELVQQFHNDGAILLKGVFSTKWIDIVQHGIKRNMQQPSKYAEWLQVGKDSGFYFNDYCNWKTIPEFREYIEHSPAAEVAGCLINSKTVLSDIRKRFLIENLSMHVVISCNADITEEGRLWAKFYHEHVLVKEPGSEKATPWHHDQSYYPINGDKVCSIWMPVDSISHSCSLRLVRGSHHWGWFKPRKFATELDYFSTSTSMSAQTFKSVPLEEIDAGKHDILQWEVEPGDCIVFHMRTLHGAEGNISTTQQRRVLATRWLGDDASIVNRPWKVSPPLEAVFEGEPSLDQLPTVWQARK